MSVERESNQFNIEEIARLAKEIAIESGSHAPTLVICGTDGTLAAQPHELPDEPELRHGFMYAVGGVAAQTRKVGALREVFFIAEGWMSEVKPETEPRLRPSQDPNRREVLNVVSLRPGDLKSEMVVFEMIRGDRGQLIGLEQLEMGDSVKSKIPILEAFIEGFQRERTSRLN